MYPTTVTLSFKSCKSDRVFTANSQKDILSVLAEIGLNTLKDIKITHCT